MKEMLNLVVAVVVLPALASALAMLSGYVARRIKNEKLRDAFLQGADAVQSAVDFVSQRVVDDLKKQGAFDGEAAASALNLAKQTAEKLIPAAAFDVIAANVDLDKWLEAQIEGAVWALSHKDQ